ncbi:gp5.1 hypothetical protein [Aeromonas phage 31]|uniref:Uncharacterized protein 5.1 n=2 Tax=Biquartavirus TaxID=1912143 RepID=Q56EM6_9CAUD|nr:hypothetical protein PHG31p135 [Aeromonas phage 31]APU01939.1 hypothetical protein [Aeromonas phage L9-6]UYD59692.1 hypothetical protein JNMOADIG_00180 [Aeromonas phage avDM5]UYD60578.1 hypothetical protein NPHMPGLK_00243 [Aeromonas phage avDM2]AAX63624.1 gp5.1 hypothetical protein [Aeromonas phage 31]UYD60830.1 hypothetical protein NHNEHLNL_00251 [Aeromonas phage avDM2]
MSDILPASTILPVTRENTPVSQTFTANLTEAGASLVSITVTQVTPNEGIIVAGSSFSGEYTGVFSLNGGLKYRLKTGERLTASKWEELPSPLIADLYSFEAPQSLEKTFTYSVVMIYDVVVPVEPGLPVNPPVRHTIQKTYSQKVVGTWTIWANNLRDYVNRGR